MGEIERVLDELDRRTGAKGSVVVTHDGMIVAGHVDWEVQLDVVGALSSFLIMATERCLRQGSMGGLTRMTMIATHGRLVLLALNGYFLVVLIDQFADMDQVLPVIHEAAETLSAMTRMEV